MREVEFRGQSTMSGKWFYGSLIKDKSRRWISVQEEQWNLGVFDNFDVIPETVGQYTGLRDRSGKKIFEGDIVYYLRDDEGIKRVIEYKNEEACFVARLPLGDYSDDETVYLNDHDFEITGNIHEHSHLLEVAK